MSSGKGVFLYIFCPYLYACSVLLRAQSAPLSGRRKPNKEKHDCGKRLRERERESETQHCATLNRPCLIHSISIWCVCVSAAWDGARIVASRAHWYGRNTTSAAPGMCVYFFFFVINRLPYSLHFLHKTHGASTVFFRMFFFL